jgi:lambda repressor-like predicted transcriptional regulator
MKGPKMATLEHDILKLHLLHAAKFLRAYLECSDEIQAGIRELLDILNDPETDEDDRDATLFTLADALFPNRHEGRLGMDLEESEQLGADFSDEMRQAVEELDREEETFAKRLRAVMEQRGLNQEALAAKLGIGQPAISNMLKRQCRPQRRTVLRFAEVLEVSPEELWPGFDG